ncbi:dual specificity protein phosphatase 3 [Strongylocentrotus purpuratus]|uniref:Dual specificity protein phosphatase n=1 Tax=Strongylocentrotus purpuratus TaxID=7668 RepID=A0A7M7TH50_STRPU|nr:dual specificity protein phosphatase 3 [Strongylocentrotus purpuratus]XP_030848852.1 dual specificity protein phosphatase 3 [Strongylocentrotus purpuratus]XP_791989.1 dual specificity protein phosphatase 3 [Strongylocentrotus purpuratus]|eukprot:XP_011660425.1 PREDICTED: dual specificity protein phosphatase 3 [Strongylocentrotus purpuratus]
MATEEELLCSFDELENVMKKGSIVIALPQRQIDEVYPNVYVGGESSAKDKQRLKTLGITHVLNCAHGRKFFHVDTDQKFYDELKIKFLGLGVSDFPQSNIKQHFDTAFKFMDEALQHENGKVLVHCVQGYSRSATIAIAYLMVSRNMTAQQAATTVREKREIGPNKGFLQQLCDLNEELHRKKEEGETKVAL